MFFERYSFPLPNKGGRYDLSQEELVKLLDSVYERGYTHGVEVTNVTNKTETACSNDTALSDEWGVYVDAVGGEIGLVNQAIDEIKLLENIIDAEKIPESAYNNFRKNACAFCCDRHNCLRSDMDIVECLKSEENWEDWIQINYKENKNE